MIEIKAAIEINLKGEYNPGVFSFLKKLKKEKLSFDIYPTDKSSNFQVINEVTKEVSRKSPEKTKFSIQSQTDFKSKVKEYHIYFPAPQGNPENIITSLTKQIKVYQVGAPVYTDLDHDDFIEGMVKSDERIYATIEPNFIRIAQPEKIHLTLGNHLFPRIVISNAGRANEGWLTVGRATTLGPDFYLNTGKMNVSVGSFCMVAANFVAQSDRHSLSHITSFCMRKGAFRFFGADCDKQETVILENDVWLGEGVSAMPGVVFRDGCVVGSGSVVTKSCEPFGIYAGNPAKLIRYRFSKEKINLLTKSGWWNWSYRKLKERNPIFLKSIDKISVGELKEMLS